jgi:hypothetical protein
MEEIGDVSPSRCVGAGIAPRQLVHFRRAIGLWVQPIVRYLLDEDTCFAEAGRTLRRKHGWWRLDRLIHISFSSAFYAHFRLATPMLGAPTVK